jgi:hypothetical protein
MSSSENRPHVGQLSCSVGVHVCLRFFVGQIFPETQSTVDMPSIDPNLYV